MTKTLRNAAAMAAFGVAIVASAGTSLEAQAATAAPQTTQAPKHHSKMKGALVGAAAGHVMGGHAKAGAVAGALVQHHRNKKATAH